MIYLDHHATTPLDPRVRQFMQRYWTKAFGNAHSRHHQAGWRADNAVTTARQAVADLIGADASEIIFTSSASEANNMVLLGIAGTGQILLSAVEHASVKAPAEVRAHNGQRIQSLPVAEDGRVQLPALQEALKQPTLLVSVQAANHEIGTLQDLPSIVALCHDAAALVHVDAAQAAGKIALDVKELDVDFLSLSSHKLHGPSGIGALFVRRGLTIAPLVHGGGQEFGLRAGTVPMPLAAGFGAAVRIAIRELPEEFARLERLRNRLWQQLSAAIDGIAVNGGMANRLPGNLNVSLPLFSCRPEANVTDWIDAEAWLRTMPELALSTGAACGENAGEPSPILAAIGCSPARIAGSVRIGLGRFTHQQEIDRAARIMVKAYRQYYGGNHP